MEEYPINKEDFVNAMVETAKNPQNAVRIEVSNQVSEKLRNDTEVKKQVKTTADKVVQAGLTTVENEADSNVHQSEKQKLMTYFEEHKEELATAGIDNYTYMEDMKRAVKWHRICSKFHWIVCGWWMTLIRTFLLKARPFKWLLNSIGVLLNLALIGGVVYVIIHFL